MYAFAKHGIKTMDTKRQSIWNLVADLDRNNPIDWDDVCKYLKKNMSKKRARSYIKKLPYAKDLNDVISEATREETAEEQAVEHEIESDFARETRQSFEEMQDIADKNKAIPDTPPTESQSFGDDVPIDFGDLKDGDGFNTEGDDADQT
jgi:hypothetical protein